MDDLKLQANKRKVLGKKTRFLRRQGITPTHLFGHNVESLSLQCDTAKLQQIIAHAGTTRLIAVKIEGEKHPRTVFVREIQKDEVNGQLLHVDFYQVRRKEKIKAVIPIVLVGEAPAMHLKGRILIHALDSLSVECLPDKLPPHIEVDLAPLEEVEQSIHVRDITLSPDITLFTDPEQMVVKVSEARVERVEEVVEEEVVEEEAVAEAEEEAVEKPEQQPAD
jgi:large subunit ribosomal protein L25